MQEQVKTCTIKREVDGWYVIFTVETGAVTKLLPKTNKTVGIDLGIEAFATLSTGQRIENKRFMKEAQRELKQLSVAYPVVKSLAQIGARRKSPLGVNIKKYNASVEIFSSNKLISW